ncbi:biotin synthase [Striga asiatica]|uniref:Biotin synthase n=1 Tax=Striga asiatica TaxID=4170 RepID=A0A5A7QNG4_STRAF|nr:biotin synthase [Striga asiatica]
MWILLFPEGNELDELSWVYEGDERDSVQGEEENRVEVGDLSGKSTVQQQPPGMEAPPALAHRSDGSTAAVPPPPPVLFKRRRIAIAVGRMNMSAQTDTCCHLSISLF